MILDESLEMCDAVAVDGAAAPTTALLGDVIDLGAAQRDIGNGESLWWVVTVDTEIITGGAAGAIEFKLVSDAQEAIATDGSATQHLTSGSYVTDDAAANSAQLNAGGVIACIQLPLEGPVYERYLGTLVTRTTTAVTAGAINSFLTKDPRKWKAYPDGAN